MSATLWLAAALASAVPGPALLREADRPDGAPQFAILDARGERVARIECMQNGYVDADALAARLMASPQVMAAVIAKDGRIAIEDLGPVIFDCVVVAPEPSL